MIKSPYDLLASKALVEDAGWEDIEGQFTCHKCYQNSLAARYSESKKLVVWECAAGHRNQVEGFRL